MNDKKLYLDNCIRAVRQATYGRDNRQPIVMALQLLAPDITGHRPDDVENVKAVIQRKINEIDNIYHSFNGGNATLISGDSYRLNL